MELQYEIGWYLCGFILFQILINIAIVIYYSIRRIYILYLKMKGLLLLSLSKQFKCIDRPKQPETTQSSVASGASQVMTKEQESIQRSRNELKRRMENLERFKKEKQERHDKKAREEAEKK